MGKTVGVIGDTHEPWSKEGYRNFVYDTFEANDVDVVAHIGDIIDSHNPTRHQRELGAPGPNQEFDMAMEALEEWYKLFPAVHCVEGNHDIRVYLRAAEVNIPEQAIPGLHSMLAMPKGWTVQEELIIDNVLYRHQGKGGLTPAFNTAKDNCMSTVLGHNHSKCGVKLFAGPRSLMFGMDVGCGVDKDSVAMRYGRRFDNKPIVACGIVRSEREAYNILMNFEDYRDV